MKTVRIKAYEFSELSDKAKERARQWWRESSSGDNYWSESTIEEAVEQGKLLGITFKERQRTAINGKPLPGEPCIWWRGFSSQGDGACFEGAWGASAVKADKVADGWGESADTTEIKRIASEFDRLAKEYPEASFLVVHRGHYQHEHCTEFDFERFPDSEEGESWLMEKRDEYKAATEDLKEAAKDFMRWIYRRLESEWEYQNSDAAVDESITANEYLFTEDGSRSAVL